MSGLIKVLVVDDSAFMRRLVTQMLEQDSRISVTGFARNGEDALRKIRDWRPDVVTMDVEMPVMDGLEALKRIMNTSPLPVVMLSALTDKGTEETIKALEAGAVDFVTKPGAGNSLETVAPLLVEKVVAAAAVSFPKTGRLKRVAAPVRPLCPKTTTLPLVLIGTSTGGPSALQKVLPRLPGDFSVPVVVVQHMPEGFTRPLAQRLDKSCPLSVKEAEDGDAVRAGTIYIARAGKQLLFGRGVNGVNIKLVEKVDYETLFRPSVDVTMMSAAATFGKGILGVILTGMGSDGTRGLKDIKENDGIALAQDEHSCVVYGMPRAAVEAGVVNASVPLEDMAGEIIRLASGK